MKVDREAMHRRAQRAEAELLRAQIKIQFLWRSYQRVLRELSAIRDAQIRSRKAAPHA